MKADGAPGNGSGTILALEDVHTYYGSIQALKGISLDVREGEIVTLIGANGAGKTTTLRVISGAVRAAAGTVRFDGQDVTRMAAHAMPERGISHVPEGRQLFPFMTVEENLDLGAMAFPDVDAGRRKEALYELFPRLAERRRQLAGTLSGGERQMVAMARALMPDPKVLLLDEPSAGLAPALVDAIFEKVADVNRAGVTIAMVEQNARRALAMSDRGYVLDVGTNRFEGRGRDLLDDPKVAELYLGGTARLSEAEAGGEDRDGAGS